MMLHYLSKRTHGGSRPDVAVEHSVVDGFVQVRLADSVGGFEVGDGACDAEDFVVGARGKAQFIDRVAQEVPFGRIQRTVLAQLAAVHLRVGSCGRTIKAFRLDRSRFDHLLAHLAAAEPWRPFGEFFKGDRRHFDLNIDSVEKWPRNFAHVPLHLRRGALATSSGIGAIAAGAGIERCDQHEVGGNVVLRSAREIVT